MKRRVIITSSLVTIATAASIAMAFGASSGRRPLRALSASLAASKATTKAIVPAAGALPRLPPPAPPKAPEVLQVDFRGNVPIRIDTQENIVSSGPVSIHGFEGADLVEWKSFKGKTTKNWPVVYVQKTKMKLVAQFKLEEATKTFLETKTEGNITFTGKLKLGSTVLTFKTELTQEQVKKQLKEEHATYLMTNEVESDVALPEEVRAYETAPISWEWSGTEIPGVAFSEAVGESKHNVYLIFKKVSAKLDEETDIYFTLLKLATQGIEKRATKPTEAQVIEGVWNEFATLHMHPLDYNLATGEVTSLTAELEYWKNVTAGETLQEEIEHGSACENTTVEELLIHKDGQCGAWASAFGFALAYEGIHSDEKEITVHFGGATECEAAKSCAFLVKKWTFKCGGAKNAGAFPYPATEVVDVEGVAAQGTSNPNAQFFNHFLVRIGETLYDPSYGTTPVKAATEEARLIKYQEQSIEGYCVEKASVECQPSEKNPPKQKLKETEIVEF